VNKKDIKSIIAEAKSLSSYEERLSFFKDKFKGQTCYILGCGPSLKDIDKEKLKLELKNNCLMTIKQSYFPFKDYIDFHFFNTNNYVYYPDKEESFYIGSSDWNSEVIARAAYWKNQQVDICSRVTGQIINRDTTGNGTPTRMPLSRKQYFEDFDGLENYTFEKTGLMREWGAGIMYENVLFFALHLGFDKVKTVGWDYADPSIEGFVEHFYHEESRNKTINPCGKPYNSEMLDSINLSRVFAEYFEKLGNSIEAYESDKCFLSKKIRRFKI
tara:strand:- start:1329 stop:2144 length:816 start_codon:yes stop_codon:yes gene_type:complete